MTSPTFGGFGLADDFATPAATWLAFDISDQGSSVVAVVTSHSQISIANGTATGTQVGGSAVVLASVDASQSLVWSLTFGENDPLGSPFSPTQVDVAEDGSILVIGIIARDIDLGGGVLAGTDSDVGLLALDPAGQHLFSRRFVAPGAQEGRHVHRLEDGTIAISGKTDTAIDLGAGPIPGGTRWVATLDSTGAPTSSLALRAPTYADSTAVSFDDFGDVMTVVTQNFMSVVEKRDPSGQLVWAYDGGGYLQADLAPDGGAALLKCGFGPMDLGGIPVLITNTAYCAVARLDPQGVVQATVAIPHSTQDIPASWAMPQSVSALTGGDAAFSAVYSTDSLCDSCSDFGRWGVVKLH